MSRDEKSAAASLQRIGQPFRAAAPPRQATFLVPPPTEKQKNREFNFETTFLGGPDYLDHKILRSKIFCEFRQAK
jgi:hypothetical protein